MSQQICKNNLVEEEFLSYFLPENLLLYFEVLEIRE